METNLVPRKNIISMQQPAEWKIVEAMSEIETLGADVLLTDAILLMQKAKEKVSEYIDK